jgi:PAS domain S-box-containing protein
MRAKAQQLAAIVTSTNDAILSIGLDLVVRSWNRGATELFGYTEFEAVGRTVDELFVPQGLRDESAQIYDAVCSGQQSLVKETVRRHKDGSLVAVEISGSPIRDCAGNVSAISAIYRNIGEHQRATLANRESEAKLRLGIAVAGLGLGAMDYLSDKIILDETAAALFALPANTSIPRSDVHARFHPDDAANVLVKLAEAVDPAGCGFMAVDHRIVRLDGSIRWVSARKQVDFVPAQPRGTRRAATGLLAVVDISDRKQAEDRLRVSELRYRRLFEAAQDGVLLLDPVSRKITDANPFMTTLLGYSHCQLVGKELFEIGLLEDEGVSREMFRKLKKTLQVRYEDLPLESKSGGHQQVEVVANVYDEDGRSVIQCNIRDITQRKQTEEQNKLLVAEVNHRARNLLAVVQAVAQQSARGSDPATFAARLSERIQGLAASQDLLVENQWLGVAVADLVTAQLTRFKDLIGTRVLIEGPAARLTPAAAQGIGMALHELATNAGKYGALSNGAGTVHISWQFAAVATPKFLMSWLETGGPPVTPPTHSGFGQTVMGRMVERAVEGTAAIDYRDTGLAWRLSAPVVNTLERGPGTPAARDASR